MICLFGMVILSSSSVVRMVVDRWISSTSPLTLLIVIGAKLAGWLGRLVTGCQMRQEHNGR